MVNHETDADFSTDPVPKAADTDFSTRTDESAQNDSSENNCMNQRSIKAL